MKSIINENLWDLKFKKIFSKLCMVPQNCHIFHFLVSQRYWIFEGFWNRLVKKKIQIRILVEIVIFDLDCLNDYPLLKFH